MRTTLRARTDVPAGGRLKASGPAVGVELAAATGEAAPHEALERPRRTRGRPAAPPGASHGGHRQRQTAVGRTAPAAAGGRRSARTRHPKRRRRPCSARTVHAWRRDPTRRSGRPTAARAAGSPSSVRQISADAEERKVRDNPERLRRPNEAGCRRLDDTGRRAGPAEPRTEARRARARRTRAPASSSARVNRPVPAPMSTTSSPSRIPASRTISSARLLLQRRWRPAGRLPATPTDHHHRHRATSELPVPGTKVPGTGLRCARSCR